MPSPAPDAHLRLEGGGTVQSQTYDEDGRELSKVWPSGTVVDSAYHLDGQILGQHISHAASPVTLDVHHTYDGFGLPSGYLLDYTDPVNHIESPWGLIVDRVVSGEVKGLLWESPAPIADHNAVFYTYDDNGDLACKSPTAGGDNLICYDYDAWHRIVKVHDPRTPPALFEQYAYDDASNVTSFTQDRPGLPPLEWDYG
nr:hypothetical protein [Myxococcales bacterium]